MRCPRWKATIVSFVPAVTIIAFVLCASIRWYAVDLTLRLLTVFLWPAIMASGIYQRHFDFFTESHIDSIIVGSVAGFAMIYILSWLAFYGHFAKKRVYVRIALYLVLFVAFPGALMAYY